jgi:lactate permease
VLLLITRLDFFRVNDLLQGIRLSWNDIFGTGIGRGIAPLYNPGIIPFLLVACIIPLLFNLSWRRTVKVTRDTFRMIGPAAIALFFTLGMVYIYMNSSGPDERDSMLIVMAMTAANIVGTAWYLAAPLVGALGAFISGSNTVSNIMFGALQLNTAEQLGLPTTTILALQAVGGAAGNMICIHNVVAVLTTVGMLGREGMVVRRNLPVSILYALLAGGAAWLLAPLLTSWFE